MRRTPMVHACYQVKNLLPATRRQKLSYTNKSRWFVPKNVGSGLDPYRAAVPFWGQINSNVK